MTDTSFGSRTTDTARDTARDAAANLADQASRTVDRASELAARAQTKVTEYFRDHDMQDMVDDVAGYVKKHPVQSLIAAASLGFLAAAVLRRR